MILKSTPGVNQIKNLKGLSTNNASNVIRGTTLNFNSQTSVNNNTAIDTGEFIFNSYILSTNNGNMILSGNVSTTTLNTNTISSNGIIVKPERTSTTNLNINVTNYTTTFISVLDNLMYTMSNSNTDGFEKKIIVTDIIPGKQLSIIFNNVSKATFTTPGQSLYFIWDNIASNWTVLHANCYITDILTVII